MQIVGQGRRTPRTVKITEQMTTRDPVKYLKMVRLSCFMYHGVHTNSMRVFPDNLQYSISPLNTSKMAVLTKIGKESLDNLVVSHYVLVLSDCLQNFINII